MNVSGFDSLLLRAVAVLAASLSAPVAGQDCDGDGLPDPEEIAAGEADCNENGLLDHCELLIASERDCNENRFPDPCDIARGTSLDRDLNGVPDECRTNPQVDGSFLLGFEGAAQVRGAAGEEVAFDVFSTLTSRLPEGGNGAQGWYVTVGVQGAGIQEFTWKGLKVSTRFDHDGDPVTPPLEPHEFDLEDAGFRKVMPPGFWVEGMPRYPSLVSSFVLSELGSSKEVTLRPTGTQRILGLRLTAEVPEGEECATVKVFYMTFLKSARPGEAVITYGGESYRAQVRPLLVRVCPGRPSFVRGDPNADGGVDLADAVWILEELFRPDPAPVTLCRDAADTNGDRQEDIADAIYLLSHLFLGGPAPRPPYPWCGEEQGVTTHASCPLGSSPCP